MKLKHKELVRVVYPLAVCIHFKNKYDVYDKTGGGRQLATAQSAWGAWMTAYQKFSTALKRKANRGGTKC